MKAHSCLSVLLSVQPSKMFVGCFMRSLCSLCVCLSYTFLFSVMCRIKEPYKITLLSLYFYYLLRGI
jgi:hypothetical protein